MRLPFTLFLTLKYLKPKRGFVSVVNVIGVVGVMLGVAVLIIVISVMSGFDDMWRDKILSFQPHILVVGGALLEDPDSLADGIEEVPGIEGAAPFVETLVLLKKGSRAHAPMLRGTDLERDKIINKIENDRLEGSMQLEDDECLVGIDLARILGINVGDEVLAYTQESISSENELRLAEELTVVGIFNVGMYQIDEGYVVTSLNTARDLLGLEMEAHGISVKTEDILQAERFAVDVKNAVGPYFSVRPWTQINKQLFDTLAVEKNMMFFILIFISVVAAFGIMSTLITVSIQKTREIGLLKAVGFSSNRISSVFVLYGLVQGVLGIVLGVISGLTVLKYRNEILEFAGRVFKIELFPKDLYYLSELPARTSPQDVIQICLTVLVICVIASFIPARRAAKLDPVKALRNE